MFNDTPFEIILWALSITVGFGCCLGVVVFIRQIYYILTGQD